MLAPSKTFLVSKLGPLPAWVWMVVGLGLAVVYSSYRRNKTAAAAQAKTAQSGPSASDLMQNMPPQVTFVDNSTTTVQPVTATPPPAPPAGGRPPDQPVPPPSDVVPVVPRPVPAPAPPAAIYAPVQAGWNVDQWITDLQHGYGNGGAAIREGVTPMWDNIYRLNPEIKGNIRWSQDHTKNTFKSGGVYRIA